MPHRSRERPIAGDLEVREKGIRVTAPGYDLAFVRSVVGLKLGCEPSGSPLFQQPEPGVEGPTSEGRGYLRCFSIISTQPRHISPCSASSSIAGVIRASASSRAPICIRVDKAEDTSTRPC